LKLAYRYEFHELYNGTSLRRLDSTFRHFLTTADAALCARLDAARANPAALAAKEESALLLALAPHLDDFIAVLFRIAPEVAALRSRHNELAPLYTVKRLFVQRKAMHKFKPDEAEKLDGAALCVEIERVTGEPLSELSFARHVSAWLENECAASAQLDLALKYAAWAALTPEGREHHRSGVLFDWPALNSRLRQNGVQERLTSAWISHCLRSGSAGVSPAGPSDWGPLLRL
jgi:hypothetical protein